jgi:hypothetical protein
VLTWPCLGADATLRRSIPRARVPEPPFACGLRSREHGCLLLSTTTIPGLIARPLQQAGAVQYCPRAVTPGRHTRARPKAHAQDLAPSAFSCALAGQRMAALGRSPDPEADTVSQAGSGCCVKGHTGTMRRTRCRQAYSRSIWRCTRSLGMLPVSTTRVADGSKLRARAGSRQPGGCPRSDTPGNTGMRGAPRTISRATRYPRISSTRMVRSGKAAGVSVSPRR